MLHKVVSEMDIAGTSKVSQTVDVDMHDCLWNKYIVNPMSLETIKGKISNKEYCSLESFLADVKWIQHNSHVYKAPQLYNIADEFVKRLEKSFKEIEKCPDCFLNANYRFTELCEELHPIVFARRQDSAIWPGKAISVSKSGDSAK